MRKYFRKASVVIRSHRVAIGVSLAIVAVWSAGLVWYITTAYQRTAKTEAFTEQIQARSAELSKENAQRIAKEAEVQQAAQVAAAKEAAEQAKNATASSANTIDSKACNSAVNHTDPTRPDVIVNKKHCIQPLGYEPADLVTSNGATLSAKAIQAYNELYQAAIAAGQQFNVTSSYRSYGSQVATFNRWVSTSGLVKADTFSARPGYSEHQTGFAFDVGAGSCKLDCFGSTSQYTWLQENAANYGFIQRYYKDLDPITGYKAEEWHYRYVGTEVAKDMKAKNIKTLEEYWRVSGGDYH